METTKRETAKDFFLHLLSAATLYLGVIGFITLWWQYINFLFPDKLNPVGVYSGRYETLLWAASMTAVTYPVYVLVSWIIGRGFRIDPSGREVKIRKWLWYITLFVAAMTMIIDSVMIVFNFLKGDLTIQFFLKLMVILAVSGGVFGYYLWDLKKRETASALPKKLAWIVGGVVLASIAYGFVLAGSPAKQRDLRFDEQRVGNLQSLQYEIVEFWNSKGQLPQSLDNLAVLGYNIPADPATGESYDYAATGELSFRLCADFAVEFKPAEEQKTYYFGFQGLATLPKDWEHGAGHACFESTIDKEYFESRKGLKSEMIAAPAGD
jgi:hypothetical protein